MPKTTDYPEPLRPYAGHGMMLTLKGDEAWAGCPTCGKGKWSANAGTGRWKCLVCGKAGHHAEFLAALAEAGRRPSVRFLEELAADRGLLDPETVGAWGVFPSPVTGEPLVPGYDTTGRLVQLYRYARGKSGKRVLLATAGLGHGLFGVRLMNFPKEPSPIYVCEGPWDAMALWETLRMARRGEGGRLTLTGNPEGSLLASSSVVAVPGVSTFLPSWADPFAGKDVIVCYDSDHPRTVAGRVVEPAGHSGVRRAAVALAGATEGPASVKYLCWGPDGYDPTLASGTDVRDWLTREGGDDPAGRVSRLGTLLAKVRPIPEGWVAGRSAGAVRNGSLAVECRRCERWTDLVTACRKAMRWSEGLDRGLSVCLAAVVSTKESEDQLWIKLVGPPSCGKSTLAEALSVAKQYVVAKSTLRGFHSGYDDGSGDNHSPLQAMRDKTLVIKDGDGLLQAPNLAQILSEARDVYDRVSRSSYRSKQSKDWEGLNITFILMGTSALRALDSSELGERFLDCVMMDGIDDDEEDAIIFRVGNRVRRNLTEANGDGHRNGTDADMLAMKQLTGGYVNHLRENARRLLGRVTMSDEALALCSRYGKFVAYMRARESARQRETAEREFSSRLVSQHVKLAVCLAAVLNRTEVDDEVLRRVRQTALDTARGTVLDLTRHLFRTGEEGAEAATLSRWSHDGTDATRKLLKYMRRVGVAETFDWADPTGKPGLAPKVRWRLRPVVARLYATTTGEGYPDAPPRG